MKLPSLAAAVCLAAFPAFSAFADDEPVRTIPPLTLNERIEDLLEAIEDETPETYRRISELPREEVLVRVMRALDSGVIPASSIRTKDGEAIGAPGRRENWREDDFRRYPAFGLTDRMFPYLRFDALTRGQAEEAVRELEKTAGENAPAGLIFDLRDADGGEDAAVDMLADSVRKLNCPVMVLVSGNTTAAGELLAAVLRRDRGAVLIGTETAGCVFFPHIKRIQVNDVAWLAPDPDPKYAGISPYALKPDLEKASDARLSYDELKEKPNRLDGDPVLRLAADLLVMKAAVKPAAE